MLIANLSHANRLRRRHVLEKAVPALGLLTLCLFLKSPPFLLAVLLSVALATLVLAGIPWRAYVKLLSVPAGFILAGTVALAFESATGWPWLRLSDTGLRLAGLVALRSLAATSCLLFLALTTPVTDLARASRRLPGGDVLADLCMFTYGFIFILLDTSEAMTVAQKSRLGYADARAARRSLSGLAANLFDRAMRRAERLELGLAARGYTGETRLLSTAEPPRRGVLGLELAGLLLFGAAALAWGV